MEQKTNIDRTRRKGFVLIPILFVIITVVIIAAMVYFASLASTKEGVGITNTVLQNIPAQNRNADSTSPTNAINSVKSINETGNTNVDATATNQIPPTVNTNIQLQP